MLEKLNKIISSYIETCEIESMRDFTFICKIINIYNSYPYEYKRMKYKKRVLPPESYAYALDFFKEINPRYATYLEQNKDSIYFSKDYNTKGSYCDTIDGKKIISVLSKESIEDAYDIVHEIIHHMTLEEEISYARNLFCETLSYLAEELQYEYYEQQNIVDCQINSKKNISVAYHISEQLEYELNFIKIYLENGIITIEDLYNLCDESKNKDLYCNHLEDILNNGKLNIIEFHRIVIGLIFAYYMLDNIHTDEISLQNFFELNDNINNYEIEEFINYLNLKCKDDYILDLDDESYSKLEKSFVKILKSRCNSDKEKMVWLNDHLNDEDMTVLDGLDNIGGDFDKISIIDLVKNVEKNIELESEKKR